MRFSYRRKENAKEIKLKTQKINIDGYEMALGYFGNVYTGNSITPDVSVWNQQNMLTKNTDYDVSYSNNINAGTATIKKLTKNKTYYVRVRAYKTVKGKKIYGAYSSVKKVKVTK